MATRDKMPKVACVRIELSMIDIPMTIYASVYIWQTCVDVHIGWVHARGVSGWMGGGIDTQTDRQKDRKRA